MGVFTIFCAVCAGPAFDLTFRVQDRKTSDDPDEENLLVNDWLLFDHNLKPYEFLPGWGDSEEDYSWLNRCHAYTAFLAAGLSGEGPCDDYGSLEAPQGKINVCKLNFEEKHPHGILVHSRCVELLREHLPEDKFSNFQLLTYLIKNANELGSALERVSYGGIEKNFGQDYEIRHYESHFVSLPYVNFRGFVKSCEETVSVPSADKLFGTKNSAAIPADITRMIFSFLDPMDLRRCQQVSKSYRDFVNSNAIWKPRYEFIAEPLRKVELPPEFNMFETDEEKEKEKPKRYVLSKEEEEKLLSFGSYQVAFWQLQNPTLRNTLRIHRVLDEMEKEIRKNPPEETPRAIKRMTSDWEDEEDLSEGESESSDVLSDMPRKKKERTSPSSPQKKKAKQKPKSPAKAKAKGVSPKKKRSAKN